MLNPAITSRIPLVCRPKPPGIPLAERISALTALTVQPAGADQHQLVARASGILNFAALIASDAGLHGLASDLCWRQHRIFAGAARMDQDVAVMALMPIVNIARQLVRDGDGQSAFDLLQRIYRAAQLRGTITIGDHHIDMSLLIQTDESHRRICTELWITLLTDGARALARVGRWTEAAEAMAAHRGVGNRLLDGRQIMIMSLIAQDRADQAIAMIDASTPAEPWESTVADLLRVGCRPETLPARQEQLDHAVSGALAFIRQFPEPTTAVFRVRVGLTALDLTGGQSAPRISDLRAAVLEAGRRDAYAARDVLHHPGMRSQMTWQQQHELGDVLTAAALGTKYLPPDDMNTLMASVRQGEDQLSALLARQDVTAVGNY